MMEKKKATKTLLFSNFIPIIAIHICFLPFWFSNNISFRTMVGSIELVFNVVLLPLYLIIFNYIYSIKKKQFNFLPNIALMLSAAIFGNCLYYFNWGITTGRMFSPDGETIWLFQLETKIIFISIWVLGIIWQGILLLLKRRLAK